MIMFRALIHACVAHAAAAFQVLPRSAASPHNILWKAHQCRCIIEARASRGLPPIPSKVFTSSLQNPSNYTAVIDQAQPDQITVIKFQARWCHTCRAMAPKLDSVAKRYPSAQYFVVESLRNGKAAGERMHSFFVSRNAVSTPLQSSTHVHNTFHE